MSYLSFSQEEITNFLKKSGFKTFHFKQIQSWIFQKNAQSFDQMTDLGLTLREKLKENYRLYSIKLKDIEVSKDNQTKKYLFQLEDNKYVEAVLILSKDRKTICLSTQIGCPVGCLFCASGKMGFFRNLKTYEILEQLVLISADIEQKPTNIVFMGMGEPLLNYREVIGSIKIICDEKGFNISQRKITLSTIGIIEKIKKLKEENLKINLAISLHAPNDEIRNEIIPFSKNYKIKELLKEARNYFEKTKRDISIEYILIAGINDHENHAKLLVKILNNLQCSINLIPYNPIENSKYSRSKNINVRKFKAFLEKNGLKVMQRYKKGDDIAAACGQLAIKSL